MNNLWSKANYRANIDYVIDAPIKEYDISKANINVLRDANIITEELYQYLLVAPKIEREVYIGKMQGNDPNVTAVLKQGIENARKVFMEINNINPSEVLSIRNDAIMVISNRPMILDITQRVKFRLSGDYRSFYKINNLNFYYNYNLVTEEEVLDVKGMDESAYNLHKDYMIEFLAELFYAAQIEGVQTAMKLLSMVYTNYINKLLDIGYYRELNSLSRFKIINSQFYADFLTEWDKKYVDLSYNENIFRHLNKIFSTVYFKK